MYSTLESDACLPLMRAPAATACRVASNSRRSPSIGGQLTAGYGLETIRFAGLMLILAFRSGYLAAVVTVDVGVGMGTPGY